MALQRPNVIVYQEFETIDVATDIPDLNVLIVGPCYQILDYLDDKDDCYESTPYGELNGTIPVPLGSQTYTNPSEIVFAAPTNLVAGGIIDEDSVKVYFDECRAVVSTSDPTVTTDDANYYGATPPDARGRNWLSALNGTTGISFGANGVETGDVVICQIPDSPYEPDDFISTVKDLAYTFMEQTTTRLDLIVNGVAPGDIVTISGDGASPARNGTYTVKRVINQTWFETEEVITGSVVTGVNTARVRIVSPLGVIRVDTDDAGGDIVLFDWCYLYATDDFTKDCIGGGGGDLCQWRIERDLSDVLMDGAGDVSVDGNEITVATALTTDISATLLAKPITYSKVYIEYMALRTDLQEVNTIDSYASASTLLGKLDARNPLFVGYFVASLNTTTPVKVYGLGDFTTETAAYLDFIDKISTEQEVYAIVPLTYNTTVLGALNQMATNLADPNYVLTNGIRQKFRAIIGALELETTKYMWNAEQGATTEAEAGSAPTGNMTAQFSGLVGAAADFVTNNIIPGDQMIVDFGGTPATYTVAHVNSATELEVDTNTGPVVLWTSAAAEVVEFESAAGVSKYTLTDVGGAEIVVTPAALDDLYTIFYLPNATFVTSGLMAGDTIEIPSDPNAASWTTSQTYTVDTVVSQERLKLRNNGSDQSDNNVELPHLVKKIGGAAVTQGSVWVRIYRDMDKTQQVSNMVATAASFFSKRLLLCYPDEVDVTDLLDGSKVRTDTTAELADAQEGYYLSCAVGGQTAGNPPQQGFTFKGVNGISRIYNASEYFTEEQMTDLSNGGVYVFQQDTPAGLPYSIHEVTTDTTALQTGEYMLVKNFDFVSLTFLNTLFPFIGRWNLTDEAIAFIREACLSTIDTLKSRYVSKIGPPLLDGSIASAQVSTISSDRLEIYINVDLPMVLNTIGLHLVA